MSENRFGSWKQLLSAFQGKSPEDDERRAAELEEQAMETLLRRLNEIDPLTARRLTLVFEWEVTIEELITMEDRGIEKLADLVIEHAKAIGTLPEDGEGTEEETKHAELVKLMRRKQLIETALEDVTHMAKLARELAGEDQYVASLLIPLVQEYTRATARDIRDFGRSPQPGK